jgi:hypothetical protein
MASDSESLALGPEPLDREIIDLVVTWPGIWSDINMELVTATRDEAIKLLVERGLFEARLDIQLTFKTPRSVKTLFRQIDERMSFRLRVSGDKWGRKAIEAFYRATPRHWWNGTRLRGQMQIKPSDFLQLRLTDQGELAMEDIRNGHRGRVVSFVRRIGFYSGCMDVEPKVGIESSTVQESETTAGATPPTTVVVANANASASVGDVTVNVQNALDLDGLARALAEEFSKRNAGEQQGTPQLAPAMDSESTPKQTPPDDSEQCEATGDRLPLHDGKFCLDGSFYHVEWSGESGRVSSDLIGMKQLCRLIQTPGESVAMLALVGAGSDERIRNDMRSVQPAMTPEARAMAKQQVDDLKDEHQLASDTGNQPEMKRLQNEIDRIVTEVGRATGFGGRDRDLNNRGNKLRVRIAGTLATAYGKLRAVGLPKAAEHFSLTISADGTGKGYVYSPATIPPPKWQTSDET